MKKVLSIVLAIAMIASMSVVAFAATVESIPAAKAAEIPVNGVYAKDGTTSVYKVDVSWDDFTYTYTSGKIWNTTTYQWDLATGGTWAVAAKNINFVNHSDKAINVSATYVGEGSFTFAEGGEIAGADAGEYATGSAKTGKIVATFVPGDYTINNNVDGFGTITVAIA